MIAIVAMVYKKITENMPWRIFNKVMGRYNNPTCVFFDLLEQYWEEVFEEKSVQNSGGNYGRKKNAEKLC